MDLLSLGFLLLILLASGGIAYVADGLGKKLGKKRLSVFGLRPKHVAQIGTVGMGVAVSFLTILVIAAASRDVRDWLIRGRGLLVEQKQLKREVDSLEKQRLKEETEKRRVTAELDRTNVQLKGAQKAAQDQGEQLKGISAKRDALVADVGRLQKEVGSIRGDLIQARNNFVRSNRNLVVVEAELRSAKGRMESTNTNLAVTQKKLSDAQSKLTLAQIRRATAEKNYDLTKRLNDYASILNHKANDETVALQAQVADLQVQAKDQADHVQQLSDRAKGLEAQSKAAKQDLDLVESELVARQADLQTAQQDFVRLQSFSESTFRSSRTEPLTYRAGEEVARVFIPAGATPGVARTALDSLLQDARSQAEARGAKGHRVNGQGLAAADIVERKDAKTGAVVDADALKRAIVARIAGNPEDQALVATSSLNAFSGETVSLEIAVVPNPMVYRRNEMLAETRIDGSLGEDGILAQVRQFLGSRVRDRAVQDRMIPRIGAQDPFGEIPAVAWFSLVQDVKRAGRSVRVQALAVDDTRAADPLRLEFRVK